MVNYFWQRVCELLKSKLDLSSSASKFLQSLQKLYRCVEILLHDKSYLKFRASYHLAYGDGEG